MGEQKGGSVVTENPKGGSLKTLEGFRRGGGGGIPKNLMGKKKEGGGGGGGESTKICLENEDMGEGRGSHQMLLGGIT